MAQESELRTYVVVIPSQWNPGVSRYHETVSAGVLQACSDAVRAICAIEPVDDNVTVIAILDGRMPWTLNSRDHNAKCQQFPHSASEIRKWVVEGRAGPLVA